MILCQHCGVEVEDANLPCPLCRCPLQDGVAAGPLAPDRTVDPPEARRRVRRWLLELVSLIAVLGSVVVLVVDFATARSLSWAHYPVVAIWFLWLVSVLPLALAGRGRAILAAELLAVVAFLFVLDRFTPGRPWFLPLALPVTALLGGFLAAALAITRRRPLSLFAAIAASMLAAGVFAVGLELLLEHHLSGRWSVSWSVVALVCELPLVLLLLYLRTWYRQRQAELRKLLHL